MFFDTNSLDLFFKIIILGPLSLTFIILSIRIVGLRSFSKMTAFDFVTTVAIGSLLASAAKATTWSSFTQATGAIAALFIFQIILAALRRKSDAFSSLIENDPLLLFYDGRWKADSMAKARVSEGDVWAKLREANVTCLSQVRAIVLETTGDISVLHDEKLDTEMLYGVQNSEQG